MPPLLLLRRRFSSSASPRVPLSHPAYMIWAANTSLGKTLVSTGLASAFLLSPPAETKPLLKKKKFVYLKPVQTGFPSDSDSRFVFSKLLSISRRSLPLPFSSLLASNSVFKASFPAANSLGFGIQDLDFREEERISGRGEGIELELRCETLYAWKEAVSPHLAAERESGAVEDSELVGMMDKCLASGLECEGDGVEAFCIVETAGGVASPAPSRALQCDAYRYLKELWCGYLEN